MLRILPFIGCRFIFFLLICIFLGCSEKSENGRSMLNEVDRLSYMDSRLHLKETEIIDKIRNVKERSIAVNAKPNVTQMKLAEMLYMPSEPVVVDDKLVSINVSEEVPITDLIVEIARIAEMNIQIDPTISGGIILNIRDKPLRYVYNRICGMTNTRYREKNGIIIFERDIPYPRSYYLDFLDITRSGSAGMSISTSVISNMSGGSNASVSSSTSDSFWDDIKNNIKQIIDNTEKTYDYYSNVAVEAQKKQGIQSGGLNSTITGGAMTFNKRAGILTITATEKSHRKILEYLTHLKKKSTAQVLIEMKFVEVTLTDNYQFGVDWSQLNLSDIVMSSIQQHAASLGATTQANFTAAITFLRQFGDTRILYNPRITAFNNQQALFTIATNEVYFKTQTTILPGTTSSTGQVTPTVRNVQATAETIPIGIVMSVLPSIDLEKREITLNLKPTISTIDHTVADPSITIAADSSTSTSTSSSSTSSSSVQTAQNLIPVTSINELDTIMKIPDGGLRVIGGFTRRENRITDNSIPILGSLPFLGKLFRYKQEKTTMVETLILVKTQILESDNNIMSTYDRDIYGSFSDDPRPSSYE